MVGEYTDILQNRAAMAVFGAPVMERITHLKPFFWVSKVGNFTCPVIFLPIPIISDGCRNVARHLVATAAWAL